MCVSQKSSRDLITTSFSQHARTGIVCNRVHSLETLNLELICSEITIQKKKWILYCIYRPPDLNVRFFFDKLSTSLNTVLDKYDSIIIMGDINIDTQNDQNPGYNEFTTFCDVFGLSNLVTCKTCFTKQRNSSIDVILTNKPRLFQATSVFETGLSDCHGLVATTMPTMRAHVPRLRPKIIKYRSYKNFDVEICREEVKGLDFGCDVYDPDRLCDNLTANFTSTINKHAPMKTKILRGNDAPFINKELKKAIYVGSRMKNRFNKDPCNENRAKFIKQRNKCVKLRREAIKDHFKKATSKGIMSNKEFWDLVEPYLSNRGGLSDNNITFIKDQKIITDEPTLCQLFNDHHINIVQNSSGRKPVV